MTLHHVATKARARNLRENLKRIERALRFRMPRSNDGPVMTRSLARSRWGHEVLPLEKDQDPRSKNMPAKSSCVRAHHVERSE